MIKFFDVVKTYENGTTALDGASFKIEQGEFVFIVGRSGAGKSTLLKLMMCEERPTSGEVVVNDYRISKTTHSMVPLLRRTLGVVFQDFRLIGSKTVYDNIAFVMKCVGASNNSIRKRVPYVLSLVSLSHKAKCKPEQLSGGEQQRVAIARALANNPAIILADEPTGNVDPNMSYEILRLLKEINERGTTVVVITHDKSMVDMMNKRVITIDEGKIISDRTGGYLNEAK